MRAASLRRKLLTDDFVIERAAPGDAVTARRCTDKERGSYVLGSTVDPEATFRRYNGARHANGYGVCNADYQARMAAMAYNLKRWAVLTKGREQCHRHAAPADSS
ncbi:MAG: hypothetical protein IPK16_08140 [Anaerolineales bacterium]|nr:hypothetical protein [Anaerolineales bacterium]